MYKRQREGCPHGCPLADLIARGFKGGALLARANSGMCANSNRSNMESDDGDLDDDASPFSNLYLSQAVSDTGGQWWCFTLMIM